MQRKTRFKNQIRIDPKQIKWIRQTMDTKTLAGFLDKMINHYKKCPKTNKLQKNK